MLYNFRISFFHCLVFGHIINFLINLSKRTATIFASLKIFYMSVMSEFDWFLKKILTINILYCNIKRAWRWIVWPFKNANTLKKNWTRNWNFTRPNITTPSIDGYMMGLLINDVLILRGRQLEINKILNLLVF